MNIKAGDILRVKRVGYAHWGVFIGNDEVVHFSTGSEDSNLKTKKSAKILCTTLSVFMGDATTGEVVNFPKCYTESRSYTVFDTTNSFFGRLDKAMKRRNEYRVFRDEEVVERAKRFLGKEDYNLFSNNCEHFASWCKTGIAISFQTDIIDRALRKFLFKKQPDESSESVPLQDTSNDLKKAHDCLYETKRKFLHKAIICSTF